MAWAKIELRDLMTALVDCKIKEDPVKTKGYRAVTTFFPLKFELRREKPALGVSDQVRHKPGCTATKDCCRLDIYIF